MTKIILASASSRRKEILEQIGIKFEIVVSNVEEDIEYNNNVSGFVEELALMKAQDVAQRVTPESLVIGADTIVFTQTGILGKPQNSEDAFLMLKQLSGKTHEVFTGIAIIEAPEKKTLLTHEKTEVKFREITDQEIRAYIATGEADDKAGSYSIQGLGAVFVEKINGCYFNVVGLPIFKVWSMLRSFGVQVFN